MSRTRSGVSCGNFPDEPLRDELEIGTMRHRLEFGKTPFERRERRDSNPRPPA